MAQPVFNTYQFKLIRNGKSISESNEQCEYHARITFDKKIGIKDRDKIIKEKIIYSDIHNRY